MELVERSVSSTVCGINILEWQHSFLRKSGGSSCVWMDSIFSFEVELN
jgi:hypothetical protein